MLKNGRLKICESVRPAIGETPPRNTRNKSADVSVDLLFLRRPAPSSVCVAHQQFNNLATIYPLPRVILNSITDNNNENGLDSYGIISTVRGYHLCAFQTSHYSALTLICYEYLSISK